jgi:predicted transposase YbfD/YdcC
MVSAWSRQNSLVLGQVKVDDKSNEIIAIPKLLSRLDIAGAVITINAMGCQKKIAEQIIQQKGEYVFSLKGNHGLLHEDVMTYFESSLSPEVAVQTVDGGHGRIETRALRVSDPGKRERAVRAHWSIENNLHWVLDVAFDEDSNRTRKGYSAANLAVTRHIAVNLIKAEKTAKVGVKTKRLMAGWDNEFLLKIIGLI